MNSGILEVITGCMFSGKSDLLLLRAERLDYGDTNYLLVKPVIDDRYSKPDIVSHRGGKKEALLLKPNQETLKELTRISEGKLKKAEVVAIDEINLFSEKIVDLCSDLNELGKRVIVAGLDLNFREEPFENMAHLLAYADSITKLKAVCHVCGKGDKKPEEGAVRTQRLLTKNNEPAPYDSPLIVVGGKKSEDDVYFYEARCKDCFKEPPK